MSSFSFGNQLLARPSHDFCDPAGGCTRCIALACKSRKMPPLSCVHGFCIWPFSLSLLGPTGGAQIRCSDPRLLLNHRNRQTSITMLYMSWAFYVWNGFPALCWASACSGLSAVPHPQRPSKARPQLICLSPNPSVTESLKFTIWYTPHPLLPF